MNDTSETVFHQFVMMMRSLLPTLFILFVTVLVAEEAIPGHSLHGESFNEGPRQQAYLMGNTG